LCSSYSNAQVDSTTGNLINFTGTPTTTTSNWNNGVYVNQICFQAGQAGNCGPNPSIRAASGNINFSYGTTDLNQVVNINKALTAGGNGVQLSGFNFGFTAKNGNGWDDGRQDYLGAYVKLYNSGGGLAANYDYTSQTNRKYNWTNFNFSETFANPVAATNYSNAQVGFVGRDNNYWAGNYGPEIINVSFSLKYRVDPCANNIAYSPTCAGFNTVTTGNNILPRPDAWGTSMNQIVAINTALKNGGIGAIVHGFNYGFDYTVGQSWSGCTATNQDGSCSWYMNIPAQVSVTAQLTNSNNQSLYSKNHTLTSDGTSGSISGQYLLPSSLNQTSLGNVRLYGSTSGTGSSIGNFSASLIYTADPCVSNPLYNASCNGYAVAYAKNMLLGSTVASASAPAAAAPAPAQSAPAEASPAQAQSSPAQSSPQQAQSGPSPAQDANQNPSMAQDNPAQPSPQQAGPASTSPQPAGGPPQTATASATPSSASTGQAGPQQGGSGPSKLAMSVLKTAQAREQATQAAAVQQAAKAFEGSQASSQTSSNLAISLNQDMSANSATAAATFASQQTQASQQTATQSVQQQQTQQATTQTQQASKTGPQVQQQQQDTQQVQTQSSGQVQVQAAQQQDTQQAQVQTSSSVVKLLPPQPQEQMQSQGSMSAGMILPMQNTYTAPQQQQQDTQSTQAAMLKPPVQTVIETPAQASSGTGITLVRNPFAYNPLMSFSSANTSMPAQQPTYQPKLDTREVEIEAPQFQTASFGGAGRAGNPLSEIMMQQRFELMQNNIAAPTTAVNKNVQPNELAGGVDIASMATTPAGFNAYSFVLKDAAFYEPKEVYKNQRTVDNERVLRGLTRGSDSLHQQMVDQQYKLGN